LPNNIEAEQAVIGSILVTNEIFDDISIIISNKNFYDPMHQKIYEAIESLIYKGMLANPITLKNYFENEKDELNVPEYLVKVTKFSTSVRQAIEYSKIIYDMFVRRELIKISEQTWSISKKQPFKRLKIKTRENLLPLEGDFDPVIARGKHLKSSAWNELISDPNTVILDVRNDYETEIGSFRNSIIPNMKNLTEFPEFVKSHLSSKKDKKIAMFCTGGIRCEIASSFMLSQGFQDVSQLDGGILRYLDNVEGEENLWEGECFVFDERVTVDKNLKQGEYLQCFGCRRPLSKEDLKSDLYEKGVSCHKCFDQSSEEDKERFAQRQLQIELADKRGHAHMGMNAKQTKGLDV